MTVTVAIPYWGCPDLVERSVRSVLAQTVSDLVCVVVADGEDPPLASVTDSRLVVYRLPENRGAYFAQQVALEATPHEWYAPVGADDWVDPEHLEQLQAVGGDAIATGAVWFHKGRRVTTHTATYEVGLFAVARLLALGGHNVGERIGQDTLLIRLLRLTGELGVTIQPTYHRVKRPGALTTAPETALGSPARNAMRRRNRTVFAECQRLADIEAIALYRRALVPPMLAAEVAEHAGRLRELLA